MKLTNAATLGVLVAVFGAMTFLSAPVTACTDLSLVTTHRVGVHEIKGGKPYIGPTSKWEGALTSSPDAPPGTFGWWEIHSDDCMGFRTARFRGKASLTAGLSYAVDRYRLEFALAFVMLTVLLGVVGVLVRRKKMTFTQAVIPVTAVSLTIVAGLGVRTEPGLWMQAPFTGLSSKEEAEELSKQERAARMAEWGKASEKLQQERARLKAEKEAEQAVARFAQACASSRDCYAAGACGVVDEECAPTQVSHCARSGLCRQRGQCDLREGVCVVSSSDHCLRSKLCSEDGRCGLVDGVCHPQNDDHCAKSKKCRDAGSCSFVDGTCAPTDEYCKTWRRCPVEGACTAVNGRCVLTDEGCASTAGCAESGECSARGEACWPGSDADCRRSRVCKDKGACTRQSVFGMTVCANESFRKVKSLERAPVKSFDELRKRTQ